MMGPCASPATNFPPRSLRPCARCIVFLTLQQLSSCAIFKISSIMRATLLHVATALPIVRLSMPTAITNDQSKISMQAAPLPPPLHPDFPSADFSSLSPSVADASVALVLPRKSSAAIVPFVLRSSSFLFSAQLNMLLSRLWVVSFRRHCPDSSFRSSPCDALQKLNGEWFYS